MKAQDLCSMRGTECGDIQRVHLANNVSIQSVHNLLWCQVRVEFILLRAASLPQPLTVHG